MPICIRCSYSGNKERFPKAGIIKGIQYYRKICIPCYSKQKGEARRQLLIWFREYKKSLTCAHCKSTDHRVFEFHHVDPKTKNSNIADLLRRNVSKKSLLKELEKCICLCANCHRILHYRE